MATVTPPYADPGRASFEVLDTYEQNFLLAGNHPELKPAYSFPLANNTDLAQFSVVGLNSSGKLVLATDGPAPIPAQGTLTFTAAGTADDTITVGLTTYTLKAAAAAAGQVTIGADEEETAANFAAAINGDTNNTAHANVEAAVTGAVVTLTAKVAGSAGNGIATTETSTAAAFDDATLVGGADHGGVQPIGVLAHATSLGSTGSANAPVWYSGCFNSDALVWDNSFSTDAKKEAAFRGAPTPTTIIIAKRG